MKKPWFKAKIYGWGWYPASWQGWLIVLIYIVLVSTFFSNYDAHSHSVSDTLINFVPTAIILTALLIFICYKTGEKPGWRWGKKKK